jgi:hypothetical protein
MRGEGKKAEAEAEDLTQWRKGRKDAKKSRSRRFTAEARRGTEKSIARAWNTRGQTLAFNG